MKTLVTTWILALCFVLGACNKGSDKQETGTATKEQPTRTEGTGHAGKGVVPGSHEDWCEEHGVPESQCTRCDPSLVAAFKATNDWCDEHGLPESQCLKCNPDLKIVRPAKK